MMSKFLLKVNANFMLAFVCITGNLLLLLLTGVSEVVLHALYYDGVGCSEDSVCYKYSTCSARLSEVFYSRMVDGWS